MGTTTVYLKNNDFSKPLNRITKKELEKLGKLSPYDKNPYYLGWQAPFELHNGNVYILVFWKGRLMKLEEAPLLLNKKYYDKYRMKTLQQYEWTLLKNMILREVTYLDKKFRKEKRTLKN